MAILFVEKPLRDKLGDEAVDSLIRLINNAQAEQKNGIGEFVEEKFERRLSSEISKVNQNITESKAGMIKWMFLFWIGQVAVILGILFVFFKR